MTQMGLNYLTYQETQRTNLANEGIKKDTLSETKRHNVVGEGIAEGELQVKIGNLDETIRSNKTREAEINRANLVNEAETERSHRSNESIGWFNAKENERSNLAKEFEMNRSNTTREAEEHRANTEREAENYRSNNLDHMTPSYASTYAFNATNPNGVEIATFGVASGLDKFTSILGTSTGKEFGQLLPFVGKKF